MQILKKCIFLTKKVLKKCMILGKIILKNCNVGDMMIKEMPIKVKKSHENKYKHKIKKKMRIKEKKTYYIICVIKEAIYANKV